MLVKKYSARAHSADFPLADHNSWPIPVGRFQSVQNIKHFNRESRPIITESVVESADSTTGSADSTSDSSPNLARICVWVGPLKSGHFLRNKDNYLTILF